MIFDYGYSFIKTSKEQLWNYLLKTVFSSHDFCRSVKTFWSSISKEIF